MKKRFFTALTVLLLATSFRSFAAESTGPAPTPAPADASMTGTNAADDAAMKDLSNLVAKINAKLQADQTNESDLAPNLNEFEALVAKHKDASSMAQAQILSMKVQLYMEVLDQPEKALALLKQIKTTYPTAQINGNTDDTIAMIQGMLERKKITAALVPGALFPDFKENDVEGKPLSISQYKGKVVLVDFWATWCMPCVIALPEIQKSYEQYHSKGFEVVGVSLDEDKDRLQQFIKQKKMPWPQFFDGKKWSNKLAVKYGVDSTPTGYLINRDGKIIAKINPGDDVYAEVGKALKD